MKSFYKFIWVPATFLLFQSCFVAKEYESPDVEQTNYYRTDSIPQDSLTMADVSWRDIFTDPVLQKHIDSALVHNIDIRMALQQIAAANAYVKQGKAGYLPTLSANAQYSRNYPSKNGQQAGVLEKTGADHFNNYSLSADLSWEADIWGRIRSQKRAFDASYLQTVASHQAVKTELIANIAASYYQLLALDEEVEVTKRTIATRRDSWETTKALKKAGTGVVNSTAVQQTHAQYLAAKSTLVELQKQARLMENTICLLMGDEPHTVERSSLENQAIDTDLKIGVPAQLLRNRPDVIAAENNYRNAFEMTNVAKANFYPSLSIGASGGFESGKLDNWFDTNSLFANLMGGLTAPIFNGRKIRTEYEVSQIEQEQARLNFKGALIQASKDVSDALYDYQAATKTIDYKKDEHQLLEQAVKDSRELLRSGYNNFSYLEVLTAQESVLNTNLEVIEARVDQLNSMVDLYQALGGGWY